MMIWQGIMKLWIFVDFPFHKYNHLLKGICFQLVKDKKLGDYINLNLEVIMF